METIIGSYKEFIVIERKELETIEQMAKQKLENNKKRPLSESSIEAKAVLDVIKEIKRLNVYNRDFQFK